MKVKIDFRLNRHFGVVEQMIFRLTLNGFTNAREIANALPLFSDAVIANGIKTLVNQQILSTKTETGRLSLSEPVVAVIEMCIEKRFDINVPFEIQDKLTEEGLLISSSVTGNLRAFRKTILSELLPGIQLNMYIDSLDFILIEDRRGGRYD